MQMFIKKQIGKTTYTFVAEGKNLYEMVKESQKLSFPDRIDKCGNCESDDLYLNAREAGDKGKYLYTEIRCRACKAQAQFGQTVADPNVFYLRKNPNDKGVKIVEWKVVNKDDNPELGTGQYIHE